MNRVRAGLGLLLMAVACAVIGLLPDSLMPDVPRPEGPDLVEVFRSNPDHARARQDARTFGEICEAVADTLEFDFAQGDKARIKTGHHVAIFRNDTRELTMVGARLSSLYSALPEVIERYLSGTKDPIGGKFSGGATGVNGGPLSAEEKAKWVKAFRTLSECAFYAAGKL